MSFLRACVRACVPVCPCRGRYVGAFVCVCVWDCISTHLQVNQSLSIYIYIYIYTHTYTHAAWPVSSHAKAKHGKNPGASVCPQHRARAVEAMWIPEGFACHGYNSLGFRV